MSAVVTISPRAFVVWFRDLHRWSVGSFVQTDWRWPDEAIKPLSVVLSRKTVEVDRASPHAGELRLVTVHFDGEMELRDANAGSKFKGRLFHADPGDVIYSKIDVRNGAIGIVPDDFGRVCVSSEYPVYTVDQNLAEAEYVKLVFRTDAFRRKINSMISGASGRKRVQPADLVEVQVPLPPLAIQRKIVAAWDAARKDAAATAEKIARLERDIETQFLNAIGIRVEPPRPVQGPLVMQWSEFERWDLFYYRHDFLSLEKCLDSIKTTTVGQGLRFASRGWQRSDFPQGTFRYVEISNVTKADGIIDARLVAVNAAPSRATTVIHAGELIISTTRPYLGAFAIVPREYDGCVCSSGFALCTGTRRDDLLLPFVLEFLKSAAGLRQMERRMTGGLYPAITQDELEKVRIPVPRISMQCEIVERIAARRAEIAKLKADAKARAEAAKTDVEAMILGTKGTKGK
jgi:hypothetical protein